MVPVVPRDHNGKYGPESCRKARGKETKSDQFEPTSVYGGLSHWSQVLGLASCDTMVDVRRNSKQHLDGILFGLRSNVALSES